MPKKSKKDRYLENHDEDFIEIKVVVIPGGSSIVALNGERTIREALKVGDVDAENKVVKLNGDKVDDFDEEIENMDTLVIAGKIVGN